MVSRSRLHAISLVSETIFIKIHSCRVDFNFSNTGRRLLKHKIFYKMSNMSECVEVNYLAYIACRLRIDFQYCVSTDTYTYGVLRTSVLRKMKYKIKLILFHAMYTSVFSHAQTFTLYRMHL